MPDFNRVRTKAVRRFLKLHYLTLTRRRMLAVAEVQEELECSESTASEYMRALGFHFEYMNLVYERSAGRSGVGTTIFVTDGDSTNASHSLAHRYIH